MGNVRAIVQAQMQFAARRQADLNANGIGEFGTFGEMTGKIAVRSADGGTTHLQPPTLNSAFRAISAIGEVAKGGYYFRIYLPDNVGDGIPEVFGGGADTAVDPTLAESAWCIYAWPQRFGSTGRRTFFANQEGDIIYTNSPAYTGPGAPITPGAALLPPGDVANIRGRMAAGVPGRDGNTWFPMTK